MIDLPHISNFTDFDALRIEPDVRLRIVRSAAELDRPDAVILPGSKNVPGDLSYLRDKGFDRQIEYLVRSDQSEIVGLCGGFQMIGEEIADPHRIESHGATIQGLGFLKMSTVMAVEKTLTVRVAAESSVKPPYELPAAWEAAWQSLSLRGGSQDLSGTLSVPEPWRQRAYWAP